MKRFRDWRMLPKFMTISLLGMTVIAGVVFLYLLPLVERKMMEGKHGTTKSVVEVAYQVMADRDEAVRKGTLSLDEAKRQAMEEIRRMRYSGREYLWINDRTPRMIMHPMKPELEGKEVGDQKDPSGTYLFRKFVSVCTATGEGFVDYMWPKPGETEPQPKISYVKEYKPWGWIIGSGIYVDDVRGEVHRMAAGIITAVLAAIAVSIILMYIVTRSISRATDRLIESSSRLAAGDLTVQVEVTADDETGKLAAAFNRMGENIRAVIDEVKKGAEEVAVTSLQVNGNAESVATGMEQVAAQVGTVAVASEEMAATSYEIARSCSDAASETRVARQSVETGTTVVRETVTLMNDIAEQVRASAVRVEGLGERSLQIGEIVSTIDDIADQTNLLALNAAIEAARAGEQGRGFAVVADEVRALAERTSTSTKKIAEMIRSIQEEIGNAVELMEKGVAKVETGTGEAARSGQALQEINSRIAAVSEQIEHIATASEQQTATVREVSNNIHEITDVVRQAAGGAQDSAGAASNQSRLADELQRLVGRFRVAA